MAKTKKRGSPRAAKLKKMSGEFVKAKIKHWPGSRRAGELESWRAGFCPRDTRTGGLLHRNLSAQKCARTEAYKLLGDLEGRRRRPEAFSA